MGLTKRTLTIIVTFCLSIIGGMVGEGNAVTRAALITTNQEAINGTL